MKTRVRKSEATKSAPAQQKAPGRIRFRYVFEDNYNPVYANGAYGGPTTQGEIAMNFFVERHPVPIQETWTVAADGTLASQESKEPQDEGAPIVIRFVTGGVIMTPEVARRIHDFLGKALAQLDEAKASRAASLEVKRKIDLGGDKKAK